MLGGRGRLLAGAAIGLPGLVLGQDESCEQLCAFDAGFTRQCLVSRRYAANLIQQYDTGVWRDVVEQVQACEALGESGCPTSNLCEVDQFRFCTARRSWAAGMLATPAEQGGAGLGSERCGVFGQLLASEGSCTALANQSGCDAAGLCHWDAGRGCEVSRQGLMALLRQDYHEELVRVSLRREHCALLSSSSTCTGECQWRMEGSGGRCTLRTVDALISVSGEDCPLRLLFRRHAACGEARSAEACQARWPDCYWGDGRCSGHPMALEFELLSIMGLDRPEILNRMTYANGTCAAQGQATCSSTCNAYTPSGAPRRQSVVVSLLLTSWALVRSTVYMPFGHHRER